MTTRFNYYLIIIFCFIQSIAFAQESNALFHNEQTINKNQIGIGINRFINAVFPADNNSFLLEDRYRKTNTLHYRAGLNYDYSSDKEGHLSLGLKIGADKTFLQQNKWFFYYGVDVGGNYNYYKGTLRHIGNTFIGSFLGIMYKFNKNFSISTEPGLFYKLNYIIDNGTFEANNKKIWGNSGLSKIGYLQLNFHF